MAHRRRSYPRTDATQPALVGAVEDIVVALVYKAIPDIVTIVASGASTVHHTITEMVQEPLRQGGWTREKLEQQLQSRFYRPSSEMRSVGQRILPSSRQSRRSGRTQR